VLSPGQYAHPALNPHAPFAREVGGLIRALTAANCQVLHAAWTPTMSADHQWRCYHDRACGGVLPRSPQHRCSRWIRIAGRVTYPDHEAVQRTIALDPDRVIAPPGVPAGALCQHNNHDTATGLIHAAITRAQAGQLPVRTPNSPNSRPL